MMIGGVRQSKNFGGAQNSCHYEIEKETNLGMQIDKKFATTKLDVFFLSTYKIKLFLLFPSPHLLTFRLFIV